VEAFPVADEGVSPAPASQESLDFAPRAPSPGPDEPGAKDVELSSLDYASQRQLWESFVTHVRQKKVTLGVCLISGTLQSIEGNVVTLRFPKGCAFQREQVDDASNRRFLESMTRRYFGKALEIVCAGAGEGRETRRKPREKAPPADGAPAERKDVEGNPLVKKILDDFDGEIIRFHPQ
jgi:hypothetical protein